MLTGGFLLPFFAGRNSGCFTQHLDSSWPFLVQWEHSSDELCEREEFDSEDVDFPFWPDLDFD